MMAGRKRLYEKRLTISFFDMEFCKRIKIVSAMIDVPMWKFVEDAVEERLKKFEKEDKR